MVLGALAWCQGPGVAPKLTTFSRRVLLAAKLPVPFLTSSQRQRMSWACHGQNHEEMVSKLLRSGILKTPRAADAMKLLDRAAFVDSATTKISLGIMHSRRCISVFLISSFTRGLAALGLCMIHLNMLLAAKWCFCHAFWHAAHTQQHGYSVMASC